MLVWDPLLERYLAFGSLKTAALDKSASNDAPRPCFKVFDILMINGRCTADMPLSVRKKILCDNEKPDNEKFRVFQPVHGRFELADLWDGKTENDIKQRLDWVMETRGEGLVVKNPNARYEMNGRNEHWIKVKPGRC